MTKSVLSPLPSKDEMLGWLKKGVDANMVVIDKTAPYNHLTTYLVKVLAAQAKLLGWQLDRVYVPIDVECAEQGILGSEINGITVLPSEVLFKTNYMQVHYERSLHGAVPTGKANIVVAVGQTGDVLLGAV